MNKRPQAKKVLSKKVVALNEQLARKRGVRETSKRFLIVCEDQKSAVNYFNALKRFHNLSASSVTVTGSGGKTQPQQVVDHAKKLKDAANNLTSGTEPYQQVWCVIDGDFGTKIANARASAKAHGIDLAVSTKCFEYWILLHFVESNQPTINCEQTVSTLKNNGLPEYDKGKFEFATVVPNAEIAAQRAKKLREPGLERGDLPEDQNPCSEVYKLIEALGILD